MTTPLPPTPGLNAPVQNPQDAIEAMTGKYMDPIPAMSPEQRIVPPTPRAPEPVPFVVRGSGDGGR